MNSNSKHRTTIEALLITPVTFGAFFLLFALFILMYIFFEYTFGVRDALIDNHNEPFLYFAYLFIVSATGVLGALGLWFAILTNGRKVYKSLLLLGIWPAILGSIFLWKDGFHIVFCSIMTISCVASIIIATRYIYGDFKK